MLAIHINEKEIYHEVREEFIAIRPMVIHIEHSLISLSKWESKWHKPFLGMDEKSYEESLDYIRCMTITTNVPYDEYYGISGSDMRRINEYLEDPMTATWFKTNENQKFNREIITAERIYYWMISNEIPFDPCEKWHLNRLLTLIRVCNAENTPGKKMSKREIAEFNRSLNMSRRAKNKTSG